MVLDDLPGLYGLKYDSVTAYGLPLYLCSYKLNGSATGLAASSAVGASPSRRGKTTSGRCRRLATSARLGRWWIGISQLGKVGEGATGVHGRR